jgi:hypothetical protein
MCKIDRHVDTLIAVEEKLQREYDSIFENLLNDAREFEDGDLRSFRRLGKLRKLQRLNATTILALQYLRLCLWDMEDGLFLGFELEPKEAVERLRSINEALAGPSQTQVRRMDEAIPRTPRS